MGTPGVKRHLSESDGVEMGEKTSTWLLPAWRSRCPASNLMPASILAGHWHPAACRSLGGWDSTRVPVLLRNCTQHIARPILWSLTLQGSNYNGWHIFMILLWHGIAGFHSWYSICDYLVLHGIVWYSIQLCVIVWYSVVLCCIDFKKDDPEWLKKGLLNRVNSVNTCTDLQ